MSVAIGLAAKEDPDAWLAKTDPVPGSWWEPWSQWAAARSGGRRSALTSLGNDAHPPLFPAPGQYVLDR
jgi:polyhydroxyalkanoate synthase